VAEEIMNSIDPVDSELWISGGRDWQIRGLTDANDPHETDLSLVYLNCEDPDGGNSRVDKNVASAAVRDYERFARDWGDQITASELKIHAVSLFDSYGPLYGTSHERFPLSQIVETALDIRAALLGLAIVNGGQKALSRADVQTFGHSLRSSVKARSSWHSDAEMSRGTPDFMSVFADFLIDEGLSQTLSKSTSVHATTWLVNKMLDKNQNALQLDYDDDLGFLPFTIPNDLVSAMWANVFDQALNGQVIRICLWSECKKVFKTSPSSLRSYCPYDQAGDGRDHQQRAKESRQNKRRRNKDR